MSAQPDQGDIVQTELVASEREALHRLAFEVDWAAGVLIKSALWNLERAEREAQFLRSVLWQIAYPESFLAGRSPLSAMARTALNEERLAEPTR